jgi:DNA-binding transcriptional LysR family regulator
MNLRSIEAFQAVMTNGTTIRAAEVLRVSQPVISKAITSLEKDIGFSLFRREKGRMLPTAEGQLFFRDVQQAFTGLATLRSAAARIRDFGSGEVRIVCRNALSTNVLPDAISIFRRKHPNVAVTFQTLLSSEAKDLVAGGQFDVGLVADEVDTTGVDVALFADHRGVIAIPEGHPLGARRVVRAADLDGVDFVALSPEDTARRKLESILARVGAVPRIVLETPYSTTVCALVRAGIGCGIVHPKTTDVYNGNGLVVKPFDPQIEFKTLLITPPNRPPSRVVADLIDALHKVKA